MSLEYSGAIIEAYPHGNDLLLFQRFSNRLYVLNATGRYVWEQFSRKRAAVDIAQGYAVYFTVPYGQALQDVNTCLEEWRHAELLVDSQEVQPLRKQPKPFPTKCAPVSLNNTRQFPYRETFLLAGQIMVVLFEEREMQQFFDDLFSHLVGRQRKDPDLLVKIWREGGDVHAEINGEMLHSAGSFDVTISWIVSAFVDTTYRQRNCLAVLHAGAVGFKDEGFVFAGASGSGKSTLLVALQEDGFIYLNDDVCPLAAETGVLIPVPMSQSIKKGSWDILSSRCCELSRQPVFAAKQTTIKYLPPRSGNLADWQKKWPVSTLIFPCYTPSVSSTLTPVSDIQALSLLINSGSLCGDSIPDLLNWITVKQCFRLEYSSLQDATRVIRESVV